MNLILKDIAEACISKNLSIAVAESVTSGYIQYLLSSLKNANLIYNGGITAYNIAHKVKHLGVNFNQAVVCNSVSQVVSNQMALNTCLMFNCKIGLAITGYASVLPEKNINDLYAYISIAKSTTIIAEQKVYLPSNINFKEAQILFAQQALILLKNHLV